MHAFLELTKDAAFEQAAKIDEALANGTFDEMGPLAGVPVAFKDNMNYEGTHTTCSSLMLENYVSPYTATCVAKTIEAGGIPLGKLNMDEFAFGSSTETSAFGPTKTRGIFERVPGGSSGGSAASVAAGLACVTLGSDTGGSIRQPAAFCGIVGVKPTYGMVSRYGVVAFGSSLDQVGPFARSVRHAAAAMDAICGHDPMDCTSQYVKADFRAACEQGVEGMRIGVVPGFMNAPGLTDEVKARVFLKPPRHFARRVPKSWKSSFLMPMRPFPHITCWARARRSRIWRASTRFAMAIAPKATKTSAANTRQAALPASAWRPSAALCWAATCFRVACTRSTIIRLSRCARSLRRTTRLHTEKCDVILAHEPAYRIQVRRNRRSGRDASV